MKEEIKVGDYVILLNKAEYIYKVKDCARSDLYPWINLLYIDRCDTGFSKFGMSIYANKVKKK